MPNARVLMLSRAASPGDQPQRFSALSILAAAYRTVPAERYSVSKLTRTPNSPPQPPRHPFHTLAAADPQDAWRHLESASVCPGNAFTLPALRDLRTPKVLDKRIRSRHPGELRSGHASTLACGADGNHQPNNLEIIAGGSRAMRNAC